jgi:hypothetical protein
MASEPGGYDREWRDASKLVPADFQGLLAFRQFKLTTAVDFDRGDSKVLGSVETLPPFADDFTLRSIFNWENWRPRGNSAHCNADQEPHPIPSLRCTCGYYASYSSTIIYNPELLRRKDHCFAAVRMYGVGLPLAQNGLRSSGADVDGVLFWPGSRSLPSVQRFMERLTKENIFYTFSAKSFIQRFPDAPYQDILGFDPVQRLAQLRLLRYEQRTLDIKADYWRGFNYSSKFCRTIRPEMLDRTFMPAEDTHILRAFEVFLKPEYRPGGRLYVHPLLDVWTN